MSVIDISGELSQKRVLGMLIKLSIPAIMSEITTVIMEYIDAAMVGSLGANATAAIGLISTTTWLIGGLCMAAATGFSVQIAQLVGAGRDKDARSVARQALIAVLVFAFILTGAAISISGALPGWLGGGNAIRRDASGYFLIFSLFLPVMQLRYLGSAMLQCSGDMKTPSVLNMILCGLDIVFNFIFIFPSRSIDILGLNLVLFGAGLGVRGAAIGTAAAELVVTALMMYAVFVRSPKLAMRLSRGSGEYKGCMRTALRIALPSAFEHVVMCGAYLASTVIVAPLGTVSIAANSLAITAESLCYMPGYGIGAAATTLVGQSLGAGRKDAAMRSSHAAVFLGMMIMTLMAIIMFVAAPWMFSLLTPSEEVRKLGSAVLRIEAFAEPLYAASIVCAGALRGAGDTLIPSILNLFSMWGIRITAAVILVRYFGLYGFWIAMCGELCIRGTLLLIRLFRGKWLDKGRVV